MTVSSNLIAGPERWSDIEPYIGTTEIGFNLTDLRNLWVIMAKFPASNSGQEHWYFVGEDTDHAGLVAHWADLFDNDMLVYTFKQAQEKAKELKVKHKLKFCSPVRIRSRIQR